MERRPVKALNADVARKIAAGEVIDRPCAIVRELMDNAVDSGASSIAVELTSGGIEKVRVIDDGIGMTKDDLASAARPHATSKITSETDLLNLTTLGFRGEALASMAAVSRLEITSGGWKMNASLTEDHLLTPTPVTKGTIVQTAGLFENFPARRLFLKRPASETMLCRSMFEEKVLPRPDLSFSLTIDGEEKLNLPAGQSLTERFTEALSLSESQDLFYEVGAAEEDFSFKLIIGEPSVIRDNRKFIFIYVNGRRIQEYSLMQAIEYGCQGYFPNGSHPVACLFVKMNSALVDFNIHPAKREARFKDIAPLHHAVSTTVRNFFKQYTVRTMINNSEEHLPSAGTFAYSENTELNFACPPESQLFTESGLQAPSSGSTSYTIKRDGRSQFFSSGRTTDEPSPKNVAPSPQSPVLDRIKSTQTSSSNLFTREDKSFHFIGSALGTFLIAQKNDVLYLIDQHAADERMRYDALMESMGQRQNLLVPYTVTTADDDDDKYLESIKQSLEEAGFSCKNCGSGRWEFYSTPIRWKGTEEDLAHDLLYKHVSPADICSAIAAMTACRAAVKDGTVLDSATACRIAEEALSLPDPHCPHGRPVYTSITREQLFSLVKRT